MSKLAQTLTFSIANTNTNAFSDPSSTEITINNRVIDKEWVECIEFEPDFSPSSMPINMFEMYTNLKVVDFSQIWLFSMPFSAFQGLQKLLYVKFPDVLTTLPSGLFYDCIGLIGIGEPISLTSIGDNAFYGCTSLRQFNFMPSLTTIGEGAFSECVKLAEPKLLNTVNSIGAHAFSGTGFENFIFPNSISYVEFGVLQFNLNLKSVTLPKNCSVIKDYAFGFNPSLVEIDIQDLDFSSKIIQPYAFSGVTSPTGVIKAQTLQKGNTFKTKAGLPSGWTVQVI